MAGLLWYRSYMDSLANTSGYYPDIHAGHADRVAELTLEAPYLVRETPAGYNQLELMALVGGGVAWNQLCNSSSVTGTSGHKFYLKKSGDESITNTNTFTGLASGTDMVIDLTLMLGSAIADYVYSLELATAGSGIQWLKDNDLIDDQYHAYSQGSLESVEATSHIAKDGNGNVISTTAFGSVTLRGIPKKDANGNLYYDGDEYLPDGTVERKWGEVTFNGSENWVAYDIYNGFWLSLPTMKSGSYQEGSSSYLTINDAFTQTGIVLGAGNAVVYCTHITDGISGVTDVASWKTYLSNHPLTLVYPPATQTTESADPFTAVQTVEDGGAEEFVTTNGVPVGNVSVYRRA